MEIRTVGPYVAGWNAADPNAGIYNVDSFAAGASIPDESIDLILTDPVYENAADYGWLAELGARVLKPGGACLAFIGIGYLPETLAAMTGRGLDYRWRLLVRTVRAKEFHGPLAVMTQELLWFEKGHSKLRQTLFEFNYSTTKGSYNVGGSNWGKALDVLTRYIASFVPPGGLVLDPFSGTGSTAAAAKLTGRHYLAFEIVKSAAEASRERLKAVQPPLMVETVEQPKQLTMEELT